MISIFRDDRYHKLLNIDITNLTYQISTHKHTNIHNTQEYKILFENDITINICNSLKQVIYRTTKLYKIFGIESY